MAKINVNITLDNIPSDVDAGDMADMIESIVKKYSGMDTSIIIYDNDNAQTGNPIMAHNTMRRVLR